MRLNEYLSLHGMSLRTLAKSSGLGVATIKRARDGTCIANRRTLNAIVRATDGVVTLTDLISVALGDQVGGAMNGSQMVQVRETKTEEDV